MLTNQYYLVKWNEKYNTDVRMYDMDFVLTYVTLVPLVNRELGTNFVVEEKYKEQSEKILKVKLVFGNGYHTPQRVTLLRKWKYDEKWEMNTFSGICPVCWDGLTKEKILDYLNAIHNVLEEHPNIFLDSFKAIMAEYTKYSYTYNSTMQEAIDIYKPFLDYKEMEKVIVDTCNMVMSNNRDFRGFDLHY